MVTKIPGDERAMKLLRKLGFPNIYGHAKHFYLKFSKPNFPSQNIIFRLQFDPSLEKRATFIF